MAELPKSFRNLLLQTCSPDFQREVADALFAEKEAKPYAREILSAIARLKRFRPATIQQLNRANRIQLFLGSVSNPAMELPAMQALQAWFLSRGRGLMKSMLDTWGVPNEDGELTEEQVTRELAEADVEAAIRPLEGHYPADAINAYLGYNLLNPPHESWSRAGGAVLAKRLGAA